VHVCTGASVPPGTSVQLAGRQRGMMQPGFFCNFRIILFGSVIPSHDFQCRFSTRSLTDLQWIFSCGYGPIFSLFLIRPNDENKCCILPNPLPVPPLALGSLSLNVMDPGLEKRTVHGCLISVWSLILL